VQSKKMPHAQPAQQFAEGAVVRGSRLEDSHRHSWHARAVSFSLAKGEFDSGGHESAREPMEKKPHRGSVQDRPHCGAPG
jgi:hypothetical protein